MIKVQRVIEELRNYDNRHSSLKGLFNQFQNHLQLLGGPDFPVRGFSVTTLDTQRSTITFIGREYEARFSSRMNQAALVGVISFQRVLDRAQNQFREICSVTFNGQALVSVAPPNGEDPIQLDRGNDCVALVLNWVLDEVGA